MTEKPFPPVRKTSFLQAMIDQANLQPKVLGEIFPIPGAGNLYDLVPANPSLSPFVGGTITGRFEGKRLHRMQEPKWSRPKFEIALSDIPPMSTAMEERMRQINYQQIEERMIAALLGDAPRRHSPFYANANVRSRKESRIEILCNSPDRRRRKRGARLMRDRYRKVFNQIAEYSRVDTAATFDPHYYRKD